MYCKRALSTVVPVHCNGGWIEIFVVFYIFAKGGEFTGLAEQSSQRSGGLSSLRRGSEGDEFKKSVTLMYIAVEELEKWSTFELRVCWKRCKLCFRSGILGLMVPIPSICYFAHMHTCTHSRGLLCTLTKSAGVALASVPHAFETVNQCVTGSRSITI